MPMDLTNENDRLSQVLGDESWEPIPFASTTLQKHRHVCAFFSTPEEEYRVLLPFIKAGFDLGEKAFHVVDADLRADHRQRLERVGIDVTRAEESGQFELRNWQDAYLREGQFDQKRMLALIEESLDTPKRRGFALTRLVAHMEWALLGLPGSHDLIEYETKVNYITGPRRDPVICTYDLAKFRGDIVIDVMRTHPMTIVGGILHENPFFVPPDEFLRELRERTPAA
jgi:hypothetical protein